MCVNRKGSPANREKDTQSWDPLPNPLCSSSQPHHQALSRIHAEFTSSALGRQDAHNALTLSIHPPAFDLLSDLPTVLRSASSQFRNLALSWANARADVSHRILTQHGAHKGVGTVRHVLVFA